jgi:putative hydrolase of the HAD superfamily
MLFDLGGVLVHTKGFESLRQLLAASGREAEAADEQALRDRWLGSPSVRDFELGRLTPAAFAESFVVEWQVSVAAAEFLQDVRKWIDRVYPGVEELLDTLRKDHLVCCLSNCNELHWGMMAPLLGHFDLAFSSHLLGQIKPDEEAFRAVLLAAGAQPEQVRYFDDSRANVAAALDMGMKAHLVHGPEEVRAVLRSEGLL